MGLVVWVLIICCLVALLVAALLGVLARRERRAAEAPASTELPARMRCPILDTVTSVRLGWSGEARCLSVVWCERFGDAPLRCDRSCLDAAIVCSPAGV